MKKLNKILGKLNKLVYFYKMKQVFIKVYGWVNVIEQQGEYSLIELGNSKICYNTLGHKFRTIEGQQKLF